MAGLYQEMEEARFLLLWLLTSLPIQMGAVQSYHIAKGTKPAMGSDCISTSPSALNPFLICSLLSLYPPCIKQLILGSVDIDILFAEVQSLL